MGAIWLLNLADQLRGFGVDVDEFPGWQTRSRRSGGYDTVQGIICHHDAGPVWLTEQRRVELEYRELEFAPVGAMHVHRTGRVTVGAAGATNTAGRGGPLTGSKGTIPRDTANARTINIEASNNGIDQPWPREQLDAYVLLVAALCIVHGLDPMRDVWDHREWTTRKIDIAGGASPFAPSGAGKWDMHLFRLAVAAKVAELTNPPPPPIEGDDEMEAFHGDVRVDVSMEPWTAHVLAHPSLTELVAAQWAVHVVSIDQPRRCHLTYKHPDGWRGLDSTPMLFDRANSTTTVTLPVAAGKCTVGVFGPQPGEKVRLMFDLVGVRR